MFRFEDAQLGPTVTVRNPAPRVVEKGSREEFVAAMIQFRSRPRKCWRARYSVVTMLLVPCGLPRNNPFRLLSSWLGACSMNIRLSLGCEHLPEGQKVRPLPWTRGVSEGCTPAAPQGAPQASAPVSSPGATPAPRLCLGDATPQRRA